MSNALTATEYLNAGLADLPVEIILQIVTYISPPSKSHLRLPFGYELARTNVRKGIRDLKNLTLSCKKLFNMLQPTLYTRSGQDEWYSLRWGAFHGMTQTMEDACLAGAPLNCVYDTIDDFHANSYCRCDRFKDTPVWSQNSACCTLFHEKKPVRSAWTPLLTAIRGGHPEAVDWLLSKGAHADWAVRPGPELEEALCESCSRRVDHSEGLLTCDRCGISPMQGALDYFTHSSSGGSLLTEHNRVKVLRSLIKHGANVNQKFGFIHCPSYDLHLLSLPAHHWNPLGLALFTQTVGPATVKFLLENGAYFEMGQESLLNPVLAHMSHCRVPQLNWKIPVNLPLFECHTKARVLLAKHQSHDNCNCVPSFDSLNPVDHPLESRVFYHKVPYGGYRIREVFDFLHEHGLPILSSHLDRETSRRVPPVIKAVRALSPDAVRLLIREGADPNARCWPAPVSHRFGSDRRLDGHLPLTYACAVVNDEEDLYQIVLALLDGGASPMLRDLQGLTPLHELSRNTYDAATARLLIDFGANANAQDANGWSPLHYVCATAPPQQLLHRSLAGACVRERTPLVELLLSRGANLAARTRVYGHEPGKTASDLALANKLPFPWGRLLEETCNRSGSSAHQGVDPY